MGNENHENHLFSFFLFFKPTRQWITKTDPDVQMYPLYPYVLILHCFTEWVKHPWCFHWFVFFLDSFGWLRHRDCPELLLSGDMVVESPSVVYSEIWTLSFRGSLHFIDEAGYHFNSGNNKSDLLFLQDFATGLCCARYSSRSMFPSWALLCFIFLVVWT